jgi:hypothetical protein
LARFALGGRGWVRLGTFGCTGLGWFCAFCGLGAFGIVGNRGLWFGSARRGPASWGDGAGAVGGGRWAVGGGPGLDDCSPLDGDGCRVPNGI